MQIFLKVEHDSEGDTLYELHPASVAFLVTVSRQLNYFSVLQRSVEGFRSKIKRMPRDEAVVIQKLAQLDSVSNFSGMIEIVESLPPNASIHVNPAFRHLYGNALSRTSSGDNARARELYKSAFDYGYSDLDMMRNWYYLEYKLGYRYDHAIDICEKCLSKTSRENVRSEFTSKMANALLREAKRLQGTSPEKSSDNFASAIFAYLAAYSLSKKAERSDPEKTLNWLERAVSEAHQSLGASYIDLLPDIGRSSFGEIEFDDRSVEILVAPISILARSRKRDQLNKARGLLKKSASAMRPGKAIDRTNHQTLKARLDGLLKEFDLQLMSLAQ